MAGLPDIKIPVRRGVITFCIYVGAILLILLCVYLFTRNAWFDEFNLSDKGTLGDAVNGLTAPIIALISASLLFYSFQAQVKANKLLQAQWQFDTFISMFKDMQATFNSCSFTYFSGTEFKSVRGKAAIQVIAKTPDFIDPSSKQEFYVDFEGFLYELNILIERSRQIDTESFYLKSKIVRFYRYNLGPLFDLFIKDLEKNEPRTTFHLINTAKMVQKNMESINYIEFSRQGQQGIDGKEK